MKEETRRKVLDAANTLGYFPNNTAQALKTNRSMAIGIVSRRKIDEHRFVNIIASIQKILAKEGYNLLFCSDEKDNSGYPEYYRLYKMNKIDGIVFIAHQEMLKYEEVTEKINVVQEERIPCVFVDYHLTGEVNSVDINYYSGAYQLTQYLIQKGHKKIGLIMPDLDSEQEMERYNGVRDAISETTNVELNIYQGIYTFNSLDEEKMISQLSEILDKKQETALITAWIHTGLILLQLANQKNINIPEKLAIASLASNGFERYSYPRITTTELPLREIGIYAAKLLLNLLNQKKGNEKAESSCNLVIRETT